MAAEVQYINDLQVDAKLDREIRALLHLSFGGVTEVFKDRRYLKEMPAHRWLLRADDGILIGHVAGHSKVVLTSTSEVRILGVAEACIDPSHRRRGYLRQILASVHEQAVSAYEFALLFGYESFYASSGYKGVSNLTNPSGGAYNSAMVRKLHEREWPTDRVCLLGPTF